MSIKKETYPDSLTLEKILKKIFKIGSPIFFIPTISKKC